VVAVGLKTIDVYLSILRDRGQIGSRASFSFAHDRAFQMPEGLPILVSSYHPSQQNTSTGRLTLAMLTGVFRRARRLIESE